MNYSDSKTQRGTGWTLAAIFVIAVAFNFAWELAQSPLYVGMDNFSRMWSVCLPASLGDGALALLIFAVGWLVLRQRDWFVRPRIRGYALMLVTGLVIATGIELVAVYVMRLWEYAKQMPLVPGLGAGLAPIAQMLLLPPLIFHIVARLAAWRSRAAKDTSGGNSPEH